MLNLFRQGSSVVQALVMLLFAFLPMALAQWTPVHEGLHFVDAPLSVKALGKPALLWQHAIVLLLVLGLGLLLNLLLRYYKLIYFKSGFPGFILVVLLSMLIRDNYEPDILLTLLLVLLAIYLLMRIPERTEAFQELFLSSFLLGFAGFICRPASFAFVFLMAVLFIYRNFGWRNWLIILIGQITAHLMVFTWYFWFDRIPVLLEHYRSVIRLGDMNVDGLLPGLLIPIIFLILLAIHSIGSHLMILADRKIVMRGHILSLIVLMLLLAFLTISLDSPLLPMGIVVALPLASLVGIRLSEVRKKSFVNIVFYLILLVYGLGFFI